MTTQVTPPTAPLPQPAGNQTPGGQGRPPGESWLPVVRIVCVTVAAVLLVVGAVSVVSTFFQRVRTESRAFTGTVSQVRVTEDVGGVRVRVAQPGETPGVTARITESFDDGEWRADLTNGTLVVEGSCREEGFSLFNCEVDLTLVVPAGIPVDIESHTGDLNVDGAFSGVRAQTNTGDVTVRRAAGPVQLRTNTGDLRSLATSATAVTAESTTGDVRLVFDVAPRTVSTETTTGDVTVLVPDDGGVYGVVTETTTGDEHVEVGNVAQAPNQIIARTTTGDVRVDYR
jgi:hypothetical protein